MMVLEQSKKRLHNGPQGAYEQSSVYLSSVLLQKPWVFPQNREYTMNNK